MNAQMKKGIIELCILKIILSRQMSTFEIVNKISDLKVSENTIYPILRRLYNEGYLSQIKGSNSVGAPRKYYELTPKGKSYLVESLDAWHDFIDSVNKVLKEG